MQTVLAAATGSDPLDFYAVAATVIPVLFVAIVIESRIFDFEDALGGGWTRLELPVAAVVALVTAIGEAVAFKVLATQHPFASARAAVYAPLFVLGSVVLGFPIASVTVTTLENAGTATKAMAGVGTGLVIAAAVILATALG